MDDTARVAIAGQVVTAAVLLIRHFFARRSTTCDYRHNQIAKRQDRAEGRMDELEGAQLKTADVVQHMHRDVAILKRMKDTA